MRVALCLLGVWLALAGSDGAAQAPAAQPGKPAARGPAVVMSLDGAIGPASADYFLRGLPKAAQRGAAVVVLRIDTPGGLDTSMREIIRGILSAPMPVLAYVAPGGARAASAGTYILYASHVAAMAPGTNLGAATPVSLGGGLLPAPGREPGADGKGEERGAAPGERGKDDARAPRKQGEGSAAPAGGAMERKAVNDAVAYIRGLAQRHGRNADWAEAAVREAASLSATEARERNVIDLVAGSVPDLLAQAHGRTVRLGEGSVTLDTRGLAIETLEPDLRARVLGVIANPNIALLLMMIGIYGLLFEFMTPGAVVPGIVGAICLIVGLYALSVLPLDYAGLGLLALGIVLLVAEALTPSVGMLGLGGVIAFVLGATLLLDTEAPGFAVSLPLVAGIAAASLGSTLFIARLAFGSRRRPVVTGAEAMLGRPARVLDWAGSQGHVLADGERWRAVGAQDLQPGQTVHIGALHGVTLEVSAAPPPARPAGHRTR